MLTGDEKLLVAGSKRSATDDCSPPAMSTCPLVSKVAVAAKCKLLMLPVSVYVPAAESYSSAPVSVGPPAMRTSGLPQVDADRSHSSVAVCPERASCISAACVDLCEYVSYSSDDESSRFEAPRPPATRMRPVVRSVAVWYCRAAHKLPALINPC